MKFGLTTTACLKTSLPVDEVFLAEIADSIYSAHDISYQYSLDDDRFRMTRMQRMTMYRRSFWPEITGELTEEGSLTTIQLTCRPKKSFYFFVYFCVIFVVFFALACIANVFTSGLIILIPMLIAIIVSIAMYLLSSICMAKSSEKIIVIMMKHCKC